MVLSSEIRHHDHNYSHGKVEKEQCGSEEGTQPAVLFPVKLGYIHREVYVFIPLGAHLVVKRPKEPLLRKEIGVDDPESQGREKSYNNVLPASVLRRQHEERGDQRYTPSFQKERVGRHSADDRWMNSRCLSFSSAGILLHSYCSRGSQR